MMWQEDFAREWMAITEKLRQHGGLDKIRLTTSHKDIRQRIQEFYGDYRYGLKIIVKRLNITSEMFARKARGDAPFNRDEIAILAELLHLTEKEKKTFFG